MPLIHSKKPAAFSKNVSSEMHAGKPQKQALAIAYSVKRKAEKKKHYDDGGEIKDDSEDQIHPDPDKTAAAQDSMRKAFNFASGGHVQGCQCAQCMAEGGQIKGVHEPMKIAGEYPEHGGESWKSRVSTGASKEKSKENLKDLKEMPNPKLQGLAEGGEVESNPDDEIQDMVGQELMGAIESKDYKKIMQGMEALILSCMNKKDNENA
jgi:hypothetical protein